MKCPVCSVDLLMTERQEVEIDYCPQCRGIWLDKGELDKIIARTQPTDYSNEQYYEKNNKHKEHHNFDDDDDERDYGHHKGKMYYDKNGKPIRKGGIAQIFGNLFD